ncbi:ABC transporter substrate-binding protein [Candidatus Woesearchaeota archaeon]|nr:ABC transporter substrate-binding protein [Candidatus Woesearchaeota archaeon]
MKRILLIILALALLTGCAQTPVGQVVKEDTIKIGFIGPLSGELASWGENERLGIELALKEINDAGGINGKKIEVIYEDGKCEPKAAATAAQKLINIDKVKAIIGETCSSATLAAAPIAEKNKVILISPVSGADSISQAGDFIFRNFITNNAYAVKGAKIIEQELGSKRVAVLYINNDAGVSTKDKFIEHFNGDIVSVEGYAPDTRDFRTLLLKVKQTNPDLIYLSGYWPDGGLILKQAKELNIETQFFGSNDAYDTPELLEIAGDSADSFIILSAIAHAGPRYDDFENKFKQAYEKEPPIFSEYAYDLANILTLAIKEKGYDSEGIRDYLYDLEDYQGASNVINFDENGDLEHSAMLMKIVEDDEFKNLKVII